jgi:anti-sigma factor (TIGR02949 family)
MSVTNLEEGRCRRFRSYLDSYLNNELLVETNHEVLKHLESCGACAQALDDRSRVKAALRRAVSQERVPADLRSRIETRVRGVKGSSSRSSRWTLAAAAALVVALASLAVIRLGSNHPGLPLGGVSPIDQTIQLLNIGLDDHVTCCVLHKQEEQNFTLEQAQERLGPEYAGLASVVKDHMPGGYNLIVGHRCHFNQREFIHLILRNQDKVLSLILTRKNGEAFPADSALAVTTAAGMPLQEARLQDFSVEGFEAPEYLGFVVSNLETNENRLIAVNLAPAVRDFLKHQA